MKHSTSYIFNNSQKFQNSSLISAFSSIKNNSSFSKNNNRNATCINFPKLYSKLKYSRNKENITNKSNTEIRTNSENLSQIDNNNITQAINICHYPSLTQNKISSEKKYFIPNVIKNKFNKINELYCSPMILFQPKMNNYKKFLSEQYKVNNKNIINKFGTKFKQRNDSILNILQTNEAYIIKGKQYKKYIFYPHEKMNVYFFHRDIMEKNMKRFEKKRKIESLKKIENRFIIDKRRSISNENIFTPLAFVKRKSRKFHTRNFLTTKNFKNKIQNMVDTEINKVSINFNFN